MFQFKINKIVTPSTITILSVIVKILGNFILLPFILKILSKEEIVVWLIFSSFSSFVVFLDFGFSPTLIRKIAYISYFNNEKNNDIYSFGDLLSVIHRIYNRISLIAFLILIFFGTIYLYDFILKIQNPVLVWLSWLLVSITIAFTFSMSRYSIILQGMGKISLLRGSESIGYLINLLFSAFVLWETKSLVCLTFSYYFGLLLTHLFIRYLTINLHLQNKFKILTNKNNELFNEVWESSWRSGLGSLFTFFTIQLTAFLIPLFEKNPTIISGYLIGVRIIQAISMIIKPFFYSYIPEMAGKYKNNLKSELIHNGEIRIFKTVSLLVISLAFFRYFGSLIFELLSIKVDFPGHKLWYMMSVVEILTCIGALYIQMQSLSNNILWHKINGITAILTIVQFFLYVPFFGFYGFYISIIVSTLFYYIPKTYIVYSREYFGFIKSPNFLSLILFLIILVDFLFYLFNLKLF